MSFREKIAWISVTTTVLVWGAFFGFMALTHGQYHGIVYVTGFVGAVIVQTILTAGAAIVTAIASPREAGAPRDERDKTIGRQAYAYAYPVLLSLVVCVAGSMHFGVDARGMAYGIMGAIVIAEIVHYGAQIVGYRKGTDMAYREKLAAMNFAVMALVYAVYFTLVVTRPPVPRLIDMLWLFGIIAPVHALLYGVLGFAIKLRSGKEGAAAPDERDRAIARRGQSAAYIVLLAGTILVGVVMPFSEAPGKIVNTTLLAIVIAELVHQGVILFSYRRGWHG